jgi:hypothetical protein
MKKLITSIIIAALVVLSLGACATGGSANQPGASTVCATYNAIKPYYAAVRAEILAAPAGQFTDEKDVFTRIYQVAPNLGADIATLCAGGQVHLDFETLTPLLIRAAFMIERHRQTATPATTTPAN